MTTATVPLHHDINAEDVGGDCLPRISLDCSVCRGSFVYCHLSRATVASYVDPSKPKWRCPACRQGGQS